MSSQTPVATNPAPPASNPPERQALRRRAEAMALQDASGAFSASEHLTRELLQEALHELQVHQIELEMQNENLRVTNAALDAARAHHVELFELAPVGYCSVNTAGLLVQANLKLATLLDVPRSGLVQRPFSKWVARADQDIWYRLLRHPLGPDMTDAVELRLRQGADASAGDGRLVWVQLTATESQDDANQPMLHIAVTDINQLKQAEQDLRHSQRALASSHADLRRFSEITAHHLQEPARRLASYADLLGRQLAGKIADPEVQMSLDFIDSQARYQQNLLRDVQRYLAADQPLGQPGWVDAAAVAAQVLEKLSDRLAASGAGLTVGELPLVWFDAARLGEVFELLIDNALRHAVTPAKLASGQPSQPDPPGDQVGRWAPALQICIDGKHFGSRVRYSVRDNGPGIEPQYHERVFRAFERLQPGGDGTGIGLALVRRFAESGGGSAWVEASPGGGCSVVFELPQAKASS